MPNPRGPLLWVTNIPTPYRVPLWQEVASRCSIRLVFMASSEPNRDWDGTRLARLANGEVLAARNVRLNDELTLYLPSRALFRRVRGVRAVLIDGWESPAYIALAVCCVLRRIPLVYFYRGTLNSQRQSRVARAIRSGLFRRAGAVLTSGPSSTEAVLKAGVAATNVVEGVNPVDLSAYENTPHVADPNDWHRFVYVGQLVDRKNVASLVRALSFLDPTSRLSVVGDGPLRPAIERQVRELELGDKVTFLGQLAPENVVEVLGRHDTLVLPSTQEVYGLVVPEALAAGLHCVVSTGTGVLASVEHMQGVYAAEPSPEALAAAMARSAEEWAGPIAAPEVLGQSAAVMAEAVVRAVEVASSRGTR